MAITSFQTGTITLNASSPDDLTQSATLGQAVTQGNAILLATMRGGSNVVGQYNVRVTLSSDGTTVTATRPASGSAITIEYQVIEASEFNVQHFEETIAAYGVHDFALTSVDTDYAFPIHNGVSASGGTRGSDDFVSVELTSATNARLEIFSGSSVTVAFQIVEMSSAEIASVQEVAVAMTLITNDTVITAVDTTKSLIFASARLTGGSAKSRQMPIFELTSSTNLRARTATHIIAEMTAVVYVVEFTNLDVTSLAVDAITGTTVTEVLGAAPTYGGAIINGLFNRHANAEVNDDDSSEEMFTASLSGSTWTFERAASTQEADLSYSVFDWADLFSGISLAIANAGQASSVDNLALVQANTIAPEGADHSVSAAPLDLVQDNTLSVADADHSQTSDNLVLTILSLLTVSDADQSVSVDAVTLFQANTLAVAAADHLVAVDAVNLTQAHNLVIDAADQTQLADNVVLGTGETLAVGDADHAVSADNLALVQANVLVINDADHTVVVDGPDLIQANVLAVLDALHAVSANNIDLVQAATLAMADAAHVQTADPVALVQSHILVTSDALHGHTVENITLELAGVLSVADALQQASVDNLVLTQAHTLVVSEALSSHSAGNLDLSQGFSLLVDDADHATQADPVILDTTTLLAVLNAAQSVVADPVALVQSGTLIVSDALHASLVDGITLSFGQVTIVPGKRVLVIEDAGRSYVVISPCRTFDVD